MKNKTYFDNLDKIVCSQLFLILLGINCACTKENEAVIEEFGEQLETHVVEYDSTYNANYNLYVVNDDTAAYNLQNYSASLNSAEQSVNNILNEYAVKMLSEYANTSKENTILSPLSASMLYSLMSNFADEKASTNVYRSTLGLEQAKVKDVNSYFRKIINKVNEQSEKSEKTGGLSFANNLWMDEQDAVYKSFLSTTNFYDVKVKGVDLKRSSSLSEINETIKSQIGSDEATIKQSATNKPLITSSVSFKNEWKVKFSVDSVKKNVFIDIDGKEQECTTLFSIGKGRYGHFDNFDMMEIPYKDDTYSMFVIIPHSANGLSQSLSSLYRQGIQNCMRIVSDTTRNYHGEYLEKRDTIVNNHKYTVVDTLILDTIFDVRLPRVKICNSTPLNPQNAKIANSTKIMYQTNLPRVSPKGFTLSNIYQSCKFEINENNTLADAEGAIIKATESEFHNKTGNPPVIDFMGSGLVIDGGVNIPIGKKITKTVIIPFYAYHPFAVFIRKNQMGIIPFACTITTLFSN